MNENKAMRMYGTWLRGLPDFLGRKEAASVTFSQRITHRADVGGTAAASDVLTRLAVVLLSSLNAVMWEVYTEAPFMAAAWAAIAVGFAVWIRRDRR